MLSTKGNAFLELKMNDSESIQLHKDTLISLVPDNLHIPMETTVSLLRLQSAIDADDIIPSEVTNPHFPVNRLTQGPLHPLSPGRHLPAPTDET